MSTCYLCNEKLKIRTGNSLEPPKPAHGYKSLEHIIPDCIGGRLKSEDVLCEYCNTKLGQTVDKDFNEIFRSITSQLKIDKDRGNNRPVKGMMTLKDGEVVDVVFFDHKATPIKPHPIYNDTTKTVTIYGEAKNTKGYAKTVKIDMQKQGKSHYAIEHCDNIFGEMLFEFNLDNDALQMQLNKIATGFAVLKGVKVRDIEHIDRSKKIIKSTNCVPYYPLGAIAPNIEYNRPLIDPNYPSHTLILFTYQLPNGNKELCCYIELFSSFQFYSLLNQNYKGEHIWESYQQKLFYSKPLTEADCNCTPSDLNNLCKQYNIECQDNIEDIKKSLTKASKKQSYELDYLHTSNDLINSVLNELARNPVDDIEHIRHTVKEYETIANNDRLFNYLRINHFESDSVELPDSSVHICIEMSSIQDPIIPQYGHFKFAALQNYILNKHIVELTE